jgi:chromosome partitioning protein
MRVMAVASQKGGSGKTTLTGHLAVTAERAGQGPVAMIDCDPQGSLTAWWNERKAKTALFAQSEASKLHEDVEKMRAQGVKFLFIDTPPAITSMIKDVIRVADMVVIPIRPSPHDLRAAAATVEMAEQIGRPLVFVLNSAPPRANITGEAAVALSQHGTVSPVTLHQRSEFAASMIDGRTVLEISGAAKSAEEVMALWTYLEERMRRVLQAQSAEPAITHDASPLIPPRAFSAGTL